jgi:hypothetical protein
MILYTKWLLHLNFLSWGAASPENGGNQIRSFLPFPGLWSSTHPPSVHLPFNQQVLLIQAALHSQPWPLPLLLPASRPLPVTVPTHSSHSPSLHSAVRTAWSFTDSELAMWLPNPSNLPLWLDTQGLHNPQSTPQTGYSVGSPVFFPFLHASAWLTSW